MQIGVDLTDEQVGEVDAYIVWRSGQQVGRRLTRGEAVRELCLRSLTASRTADL